MGSRQDELKRQFGTLWRTAMVGLDTVRDVVVRSSQTGRLRVDIALLHNERAQLLSQLGEALIAHVDEHGFDDATEPYRDLVERVKDVEGRIKSDSARATDNAFGAPRGYEPEAASDYGDAGADAEEEATPPPAPRKKKSTSRRKEAHK
jgi:hypothetical protein